MGKLSLKELEQLSNNINKVTYIYMTEENRDILKSVISELIDYRKKELKEGNNE